MPVTIAATALPHAAPRIWVSSPPTAAGTSASTICGVSTDALPPITRACRSSCSVIPWARSWRSISSARMAMRWPASCCRARVASRRRWRRWRRLIGRFERLRLGRRGRSTLMHTLSFAAFNKPFEPSRTPCDWLSRDAAEVDKYIADPLCGFPASVQLWIDLLDALADATSAPRQASIPKRLPVYVIAGSRDPVGGNTKSRQPTSLGLSPNRSRARHAPFLRRGET